MEKNKNFLANKWMISIVVVSLSSLIYYIYAVVIEKFFGMNIGLIYGGILIFLISAILFFWLYIELLEGTLFEKRKIDSKQVLSVIWTILKILGILILGILFVMFLQSQMGGTNLIFFD